MRRRLSNLETCTKRQKLGARTLARNRPSRRKKRTTKSLQDTTGMPKKVFSKKPKSTLQTHHKDAILGAWREQGNYVNFVNNYLETIFDDGATLGEVNSKFNGRISAEVLDGSSSAVFAVSLQGGRCTVLGNPNYNPQDDKGADHEEVKGRRGERCAINYRSIIPMIPYSLCKASTEAQCLLGTNPTSHSRIFRNMSQLVLPTMCYSQSSFSFTEIKRGIIVLKTLEISHPKLWKNVPKERPYPVSNSHRLNLSSLHIFFPFC